MLLSRFYNQKSSHLRNTQICQTDPAITKYTPKDIHNSPGQPVSVFHHDHSKEYLPSILI